MTSSYDASLVTLSVIIAIVASFSALNLMHKIQHTKSGHHGYWLVAAATTLGTGIWTMHFVGMLSHHMSIDVHYDVQLTLLSLGLAIVASGIALFITDRYSRSIWVLVAGVIMGAGISGMHYVGMEAMRMLARIEYHSGLVVLSIVIAVISSIVALWLGMGKLGRNGYHLTFIVLASIGMGIAISSMHYIGMTAAMFIPVAAEVEPQGLSFDASGLAISGGSSILVALMAVAWFTFRDSKTGTSISSRVSLLSFSMVVITAAAISIIFYQHTSQTLIQRDLDKLSHEVNVESAELRAMIHTLRQDALFLSNTPPISGVIRAHNTGGIDPLDGSSDKDWKDRLAAILQAFLHSKPHYIKANFIGLSDDVGELIRVERKAGKIIHTPTSKLLIEEEVEYPGKVTLLAQGEVYLSDIILARHLGKIIQPQQPVMQAAVPVFSSDEVLFGVVMITMDFSPVLSDLVEEREEGDTDIVLNDNGDFLASRYPEKDFGFEYGRPWRLQEKYPELTEFISDKEQSAITQQVKIPSDTMSIYFEKVYFDPDNPSRFIGIGEGMPYSEILGNTHATVDRIILITITLISIATAVSFGLSRRILRPLKDMTLAAQRFARGDNDIALPDDARGELAILSLAFSSMVTQVNERGQQLQQSETFVKTVLDTAADAIITISNTTNGCYIRTANKEAETIFGYSLPEFKGMEINSIIQTDSSETCRTYFEQNIFSHTENNHGMVFKEVTGLRKQGDKFSLEIKITEMNLENERIFVLVIRDITDAKKIENELKMAASVMHSALEGVIITDQDNQIQAINPAFTLITGYTQEDVIGKNPNLLSSGQHDAEFYKEMWQSIHDDGFWQGEVWDRRKSGETFPKWMSISVIKDDLGKINNYIAIFSDITERKTNEKRLNQLAHYDPLTHLPNRLLFTDRLTQLVTQAKRHGTQLSLLFLDLDHFKLINDTLGHDVGDILLQQVANRIVSCVRESDTVARLAGDEFTVILPETTSSHDADRVAAKIVAALSEPFMLNDKQRFTGISIGISLFPDDADNVDSLIKYADVAMYRAKDLGRNNYQQYHKDMSDEVLRRLELETLLRGALERKELCLYYQPQIDLSNGEIIGVEALLRWFTADNQMIPPLEFIPIAEDTGLIHNIGEWVLEEACIQLNNWQKNGLDKFRVAVNVSYQQLADNNRHFPSIVKKYLNKHQIDASKLELELTESVTLDKPEQIMTILNELSAMGIQLAMDDFGTGYSSLSQLRRLPFQTIKIDKSFVSDITENPEDKDLVNAIVAISKTLKRTALAEGIETEEQLASLINMGCDVAQGYYFSKPLPANEIEPLLHNSRKKERRQ